MKVALNTINHYSKILEWGKNCKEKSFYDLTIVIERYLMKKIQLHVDSCVAKFPETAKYLKFKLSK